MARATGAQDLVPGTLPRRVLVALGSLTAVAPLVTDLYLPALPQLARALGSSAAMAQLTMSVCLVGLALGQLVAGPLSDRIGRTVPLRVGVAVLLVTSVLCALATDMRVLLVLRLVQGLAGAAAVMIARGGVGDGYDGSRAAVVFSQLMLVTGLAPVVGPMVGGQLLAFTDWRGIFVALAAIAAVLLAACWVLLPETRPAAVRAAAPRRSRALRSLLADRYLRAFLLMSALFGVVLFTYISMSAFVLQDDYGLGPVAYAWLFGANAVGLVLGSQLGARLIRRVGAATTLTCGVLLTAGATVASAAALVFSAPLVVLLPPLWLGLARAGMALGARPRP